MTMSICTNTTRAGGLISRVWDTIPLAGPQRLGRSSYTMDTTVEGCRRGASQPEDEWLDRTYHVMDDHEHMYSRWRCTPTPHVDHHPERVSIHIGLDHVHHVITIA